MTVHAVLCAVVLWLCDGCGCMGVWLCDGCGCDGCAMAVGVAVR